jgi:hypothetical protein
MKNDYNGLATSKWPEQGYREGNWNQNVKEREPWSNPEQQVSGRFCKIS